MFTQDQPVLKVGIADELNYTSTNIDNMFNMSFADSNLSFSMNGDINVTKTFTEKLIDYIMDSDHFNQSKHKHCIIGHMKRMIGVKHLTFLLSQEVLSEIPYSYHLINRVYLMRIISSSDKSEAIVKFKQILKNNGYESELVNIKD